MPQEKPSRCTSPAGLPQERSIAGGTAARKVGRIVAGGQPRIQAEIVPVKVVGRQAASRKQPRERVATAPDTTIQFQCSGTSGSETMAALGDVDMQTTESAETRLSKTETAGAGFSGARERRIAMEKDARIPEILLAPDPVSGDSLSGSAQRQEAPPERARPRRDMRSMALKGSAESTIIMETLPTVAVNGSRAYYEEAICIADKEQWLEAIPKNAVRSYAINRTQA